MRIGCEKHGKCNQPRRSPGSRSNLSQLRRHEAWHSPRAMRTPERHTCEWACACNTARDGERAASKSFCMPCLSRSGLQEPLALVTNELPLHPPMNKPNQARLIYPCGSLGWRLGQETTGCVNIANIRCRSGSRLAMHRLQSAVVQKHRVAPETPSSSKGTLGVGGLGFGRAILQPGLSSGLIESN